MLGGEDHKGGRRTKNDWVLGIRREKLGGGGHYGVVITNGNKVTQNQRTIT